MISKRKKLSWIEKIKSWFEIRKCARLFHLLDWAIVDFQTNNEEDYFVLYTQLQNALKVVYGKYEELKGMKNCPKCGSKMKLREATDIENEMKGIDYICENCEWVE